MSKQYKIARKIKNIKLTEAARLLGISQPALSSWESERKSPSVESLENMADLYGVSTDFLLGRTDNVQEIELEQIPQKSIPAFHGKPVWSRQYGWLLVNAISGQLVASDGQAFDFSNIGELFVIPPNFSESAIGQSEPLEKTEIADKPEIWIEPISGDKHLREELRGWYRPSKRYVENEFGNRFYYDTYGAKWLAFENINLKTK